MTEREMTIEDLKRVLHEAAGAGEDVKLDGDILDVEFAALGYDSLALLEASGRIERQYGVTLPDEQVTSAPTPRIFLAVVNDQLVETP